LLHDVVRLSGYYLNRLLLIKRLADGTYHSRHSAFEENMQENTPSPLHPSWFVYLLRCADNTLYTGITTDLKRRLDEHNGENSSKKGARYTRHRRPVVLVYSETLATRASASQREYAIKQLSRTAKDQLISASSRL
jgi:putative endonuclease